MPKIQDILPNLANPKYFTSLDLASGYHQVPMNPDSIENTAFSTPLGHYQFKSIPFGLTNTTATFQRLMNAIFGDRIGKDLLAYLDDIVIFSSDFESHLKSVESALSQLERASLKCQPNKCQVFRKTLTYLGHTISPEGLSPEVRKLEILKDWPLPKTGNGMLSFLGFCNYYRELVSRFAEMACHLYPLGKLDKIPWTPELTNCFERLRARPPLSLNSQITKNPSF